MPARRTSNRMKVLNGTDRPDRMRDEPDFPAVEGYPDPPAWLENIEAIREWKHKARILVDAGSLTEDNLTMLAHYCALHGEMVAKMLDGGSPSAADRTQFRLYATEFGFTPASRSKAGAGTKGDGGNPFDKFKGKG